MILPCLNINDDMELQIIEEALEACLADNLDDEKWFELIEMIQKIIS